MAKQIALGFELYLFTQDPLGKSGTDLVISSHGGYGKSTGSFTVPNWTVVKFYGPHKKCLVANVNKAMDGNLKYLEAATGGTTVRNYQLSKFQGYHGDKNETYETIKRNLEKIKDNSLPARFDVMTIRNRWWLKSDDLAKDGVALSRALQTLASQNRKYSSIHCLFCRSNFDSSNPATFYAMSS